MSNGDRKVREAGPKANRTRCDSGSRLRVSQCPQNQNHRTDRQKENLRLTRSNLELARVREQVGVAARDEVFRWESEIARGRIEVLDARAQRQQAAIGLNRILYHPLEEPFTTAEAGLQDPFLFNNIERIFVYIDNPKNFQIFRDFQVREGFRLAPELQRLQARIAAQQRRPGQCRTTISGHRIWS